MFEVHVTVLTQDLKQFQDDCAAIGCKPLLIQTQWDGGGEQQVMTTQTYRDLDDQWKMIAIGTAQQLSQLGYHIERIKVEVDPRKWDLSQAKYLESHIRVRVQGEKQIKELDLLCKEYQFHRSRNAFKVMQDGKVLMCTYRLHEIDLELFLQHIHKFTNALQEGGFMYDKVEIEACIFDNNQDLDTNWLTQNTTNSNI